YPERHNGCACALAEEGLTPDPPTRFDAIATEESGRRAARALIDSGAPFDAIFAVSDLTAIGAMLELHDAGLTVPRDVAIVGFDDLAAARLAEPPITTIVQDTRRAGDALVETLIAKIEERAPGSVTLPVELVVRGSS
ncbi:MAG: substrate-binding domain-containing protein, partial [Sphingomicrobium sp.]